MKLSIPAASLAIAILISCVPGRTEEKLYAGKIATADGRNYKSAYESSEWCGICEYQYYEKPDNISYHNPPVAFYNWKKCFKGPPIGGPFCIKYEFREQPWDDTPRGWKFNPAMMPKIGSSWIIFIPQCVMFGHHQGFETYYGAYGRQEATQANMAKLTAIIKSERGQPGETGAVPQAVKINESFDALPDDMQHLPLMPRQRVK